MSQFNIMLQTFLANPSYQLILLTLHHRQIETIKIIIPKDSLPKIKIESTILKSLIIKFQKYKKIKVRIIHKYSDKIEKIEIK